MSSKIKAITFDVGGTLITPWPSLGHVYAEVAERHGIHITPDLLTRRFGQAWKARKEFNHRREEWASIVDDTFRGLTPVIPSETFFGELFDRFTEPDAWKIFPDVMPALDELAARGVMLGIISNWDERLRPLLKKLGLTPFFESIVISCEVAFAKPSNVPFELASRKLGVPPSGILHVGDSVAHDAEGAARAGFQWRIIDRELEKPRENWIQSMGELESLV